MRGWMGQEFPTLPELHASNRAEQVAGWASLAESHRLCREAQQHPHPFDEGDLGHHAERCAFCDGLRRQECHVLTSPIDSELLARLLMNLIDRGHGSERDHTACELCWVAHTMAIALYGADQKMVHR